MAQIYIITEQFFWVVPLHFFQL